MLNPEELAQEAIKYLEFAQKSEEEKDIQKAISNYEKAVEFLKKSGYLMHRVNEIYQRIDDLKDYLKKEEIYQQTQIKAKSEKLQDQAFALLEGAKKLEFDGFFEEASKQYQSAITLLSQSGWSDTQLENIKLKVKNISEVLKREQPTQQLQKAELGPSEEYLKSIDENEPDVVDMFGQKSTVEKATSIALYRSRKKQEEEKQKHAFALIDKAKFFEKEKKFNQAITSYERAIELLDEIGWQEQTKNILVIIEKLRKDKEQFDQFQSQKKAAGTSVVSESEKLESESTKEKLVEFEERKAREEAIQGNAFKLIDIGKRFEREKNYDKAIKYFEEAIELFKSINWDAYIQPIFNLIEDAKDKQDRERKSEVLKQERQKELTNLQEAIYRKQKEQIIQTAKEIDSRKKQFEERRNEELKREKYFFNILASADTLLQEKKYDDAIGEYHEALKLLEQMGSGWEIYTSNIKNTILNVQKIKNSQFKKQYDLQQKLEKREKAELEFQNQIVNLLDKERKQIEKKEILLKDREKELQFFEQRKKDAFKFLDSAVNYVKKGDYENAIIAYQNAGNIFAEIQWRDEISVIESSILEVEELQRSRKINEQKKMKEALERERADEAFQMQISQYLKQEREKIKKREVELREREEELRYREERRDAGFKLLEQAKEEVSKGNYDKAIDILQYSITFFVEAQWGEEINLIQNSIIEIENKTREADIQEQIKMQTEIEREKQDRLFQNQIAKEIKIKKENIKQREIILREREQEIAYREEKKKEAFSLLENAQKLVSLRKYDEVLEIYHNVISIFAQIQWVDEIPIIKQGIQDIEQKKRDNMLFEQKRMQNAIKKEALEKAFLEQLKYQREREAKDVLMESKNLEKEKAVSAQYLAQQREAFKMIEAGEAFLQEENYDKATINYQEAKELLENIGWSSHYLKILNDTIDNILERKLEKENENQTEYELALKRQKGEEQFQSKITDYLKKEQEKINLKEIQLQKRERELSNIESRKLEAFEIMDDAEELLNQGKYDQCLDKYRQSELILNQIGFPTGTLQEFIQKVEEKRKAQELKKISQMEMNIRKEQEDLLFQQQIVEKVKLEQLKMLEKQEKLKEQEKNRIIEEEKREKAFNMLEKAQSHLEKGEFDESIDLYHDVINIFQEISWVDEIQTLKDSINVVEAKKREAEIEKQKKFEEALEQEKLEKAFQGQVLNEMKIQQENFKHKEITLRKREKELGYRENQKENAFKLLDDAQNFLSQSNYDRAIEKYYEVANIFAQIQWNDEIPIIQQAILNIQNQKKENDLQKQKSLEKTIENERAHNDFIEKINLQKQQEKELALKDIKIRERKDLISVQNLIKQKDAFKLIEMGEDLLQQNDFNGALNKYDNAITILTNIGWTSDYTKLVYETMNTIKTRKRELEKKNEFDQKMSEEIKARELDFQKKIISYTQKEKERLQKRQIEIQKQENLAKIFEQKREEAFVIMDKAEKSLKAGQYEDAMHKYRDAELILNEIGFPTKSVREMIYKIQEKNKESIVKQQKQLEMILKSERDEREFQQKIQDQLKIDEMKAKTKGVEIEQQREKIQYNEERRDKAFDLLQEAEIYLNQAQYDKALDYYYSAEIILNEIRFPTDIVREMILKVQDRKREYLGQKQRDLELKLEKEKEEWKLQQKIAEDALKEKDRLATKQISLEKIEQRKLSIEQRRKEAFKILDEAEEFLKQQQYNKSIEAYRRAEFILNEIQFPTENINNMVIRVKKIMKDKEEMEELRFQREMENIQEEKDLQLLIEERQRQEREKKKAQQLAIQERERFIKEQMDIRESAYGFLEEAGKYLKQSIPDYEKAISLYILARNILAENIGWEPEINNLNALIKDLQQEQSSYFEKKQLEEATRIQRQKDYETFQEEVRLRRLEQEKLKREQERQYRELILSKQRSDQIRDEGLKLIDEGKKWTAYHNFERADENFQQAIQKFKEIGWHEEVKYIEAERNNMKILEERVKSEESRINIIQEQLEKQRKREVEKIKVEEQIIKENIGEIHQSADEIMNLIEERRKQQKKVEKEEKLKIKEEAKDFRGKVGELIKIKEELIQELEKKEKEELKFKEKTQMAKEREEVANLKRMIKEAGEKKKK
ncbi:MAG: hypothetical protein ACFFCC_03790 [Promethearchaeota archaeon]